MISGPFSGDRPDGIGLLSANIGSVIGRFLLEIGRSVLLFAGDDVALEVLLEPHAASSQLDPASAATPPTERRSIVRRVTPIPSAGACPSGSFEPSSVSATRSLCS